MASYRSVPNVPLALKKRADHPTVSLEWEDKGSEAKTMTIPTPQNRRIYAGVSALSVATILLGSVFATSATAADKPPVIPAPAVQNTATPPPTDQFIVKFKPSAENNPAEQGEAYAKAAQDTSIEVKEVKTTEDDGKVVKATRKLSEAESQEIAKSIASHESVESVEPDVIIQTAAIPNDPLYPNQWSLNDPWGGIRVEGAWDKTTGAGQVVAVIDTGITQHSDLNSNIVPGYDMISTAATSRDGDGRDSDPSDPGNWRDAGNCGFESGASSTWHGTHVAGIIGAIRNNGTGISGIAPGVKVQPIRALGECGGYMSDISDSITWASGGNVEGVPENANVAKTINLSVSGESICSPTLQSAIDGAVQRGSTVFVAAGNGAQPASSYTPGNCNNVIVVGASNKQGAGASYSNYGDKVDFVAPGGETSAGIISTFNSGTIGPRLESYGSMTGTSMAAPVASAVGALMKAADPSLTPAQIKSKLKATAHTLPGGCFNGCGAGLIDASAAVVLPVAPTPTPTPTPTPAPVSSIVYAGHVQNIGWQSNAQDGGLSGTTGRGLGMEALRFSGSGQTARAHVQNVGWQNYQSGASTIGTTGRSLRMEAIQVKSNVQGETILCQAHVASIGWMPEVGNGEVCGTEGKGLQLEAIRLRVVKSSVAYAGHVQNIGWQPSVVDGGLSGTTGRGLGMEALRFSTEGQSARAHVQNIGWQDYQSGASTVGTTGRSLRMEAIQVKSTVAGKAIRCSAHVSGIGWMPEVGDGQACGTTGRGLQLEAIRLRVVDQ